MRTPFFRGSVSTDFKLEGTLREPIVSGEATVPKGQVEFPFGTLEVKSAIVSLTAANPFQPQVYLIARARRLGYDITLQVTGPADKPVIQFSSVPSLSSDQILLLLTAGEIPRDDFSLTPQQKAQRFALFFGQRFLAKLGFGGSSERLLIRSGEDVSDAGRQTYDVEFKLDENWSLVGQYDRFNAFNLSLKRRVYSR
jgi:translocation and assembly module TamB